jgi:hypothetical protein
MSCEICISLIDRLAGYTHDLADAVGELSRVRWSIRPEFLYIFGFGVTVAR